MAARCPAAAFPDDISKERVNVAATAKAHYGITVKSTTDPLVPFLPVPTMTSTTDEMDVQLRTFREIAESK